MTYFRNCSGGFVWGFSIVWLSMLSAMTLVVYRDGPPPSTSLEITLAVFVFFWLGGIGLALFAASKHCFYLKLDDENRVFATWRYPFHVVRRSYKKDDLRAAEVVASQDSEGDAYYFARVPSSDGMVLDLAEGHSRARCEHVCGLFNQTLFRRDVSA